jgi:hypothetical protein
MRMFGMVDEDLGEYLHPGFYFVTYKRNKNGNFSIDGSPEEIPGKRGKGLLDPVFRGLGF